jgi:hypothetical protein
MEIYINDADLLHYEDIEYKTICDGIYTNDEKLLSFKNGIKHRDGKPAVILKDGTKEWWLYGKRHCSNGPAMEWTSGSMEWWLDGKRHRDNAPAVIASTCSEWWVNGQPHRVDGPSYESTHSAEWYIEGICYYRIYKKDIQVDIPRSAFDMKDIPESLKKSIIKYELLQ